MRPMGVGAMPGQSIVDEEEVHDPTAVMRRQAQVRLRHG
jgi:hypothetical protein